MAATRLISLHVNKGKTIAQTISDCIDYVKNPDKTNGGKFVTSYQCDPRTADTEFLLSKKQYATITGRDCGKRDVSAYHIRQSFKPGEITPEDANRIGYELALAFTKKKHQFIVATHIDKAHIHNHIIFNSTRLDCTHKFFDFLGSGRAVRRISDQLCIENGLSIIENPKSSKGHYGTWLGDQKPVTWQEKLRQTIDAVLDQKPSDLAQFTQAMKAEGYEVKQGKELSFRASNQKRFTRLRSLGEDYTYQAILERMEGKRSVVSKRETNKVTTTVRTPKMNLLIDIQNSIKAKNSPGYEQWCKVFNLKQAAQTLIFLQENNLLTYEKLTEKTEQTTKNFNEILHQIKEKEKRLKEIKTLQNHISNYIRTRDVYVEYRKSGYSKKFWMEHEGEIILHKASKKTFDALGLKKLPTLKTLQTEYAMVLTETKKLYQSYHQAKENMHKISTAKSNTDRLLRYSETEKTKEKDQRLE